MERATPLALDTNGTPEAKDRARTELNGSGFTAMPAASPGDQSL